jgi:hypothetical protein
MRHCSLHLSALAIAAKVKLKGSVRLKGQTVDLDHGNCGIIVTIKITVILNLNFKSQQHQRKKPLFSRFPVIFVERGKGFRRDIKAKSTRNCDPI